MKKYLLSAVALASLAIACRSEDVDKTVEVAKGTGLIFNKPEDLDKVKKADFNDKLFDTFPAEFILDTPPIANQKQTSKCTSFSSAYTIVGFYNGLNSTSTASQSNTLAGSPEYTHAMYKKVNNDDCDGGAAMFDQYQNNKRTAVGIASILKEYGTVSWDQLPFVNKKVCQALSPSVANLAKGNAISDFYVMDSQEFGDTNEIKNFLYMGHPVWFSTNVDSPQFKELNKNPNAVWNNGLASTGGHAMTIVGWSDAKRAFKVANSWGTNWGDKGYLWIDYGFMKVILLQRQQAGILFPNERQQAIFNKLTPVSCGNNNWGYLTVNNTSAMEIDIQIEGAANYKETDLSEIDPEDEETFFGIKAGNVTVKVINASTKALIDQQNVNITQCGTKMITLNTQGKINP